jgi:hypothetical protein
VPGAAVTPPAAEDRLALALDGPYMAPLVARAAGVASGSAGPCACELISAKPGRRWTVRYRLEGGAQAIGKLYPTPGRARTAYRRIEQARAIDAPARAGPPQRLLLVRELGLALQAAACGTDLRHYAGRPEPFALAARWLAALHGAPPFGGLPAKSMGHALGKAARWCAEIEQAGLEREGARLRSLVSGLRAGAETRGAGYVVVHRDYYYANLLWSGTELAVLDLDQLALGDAALDAGHFLAHLEHLRLRGEAGADALAASARAFVEAYRDAAGAPDGRDVAVYQACALVQLAATEARRRRPGWRERAAALSDLAAAAVEG